MTNFGLRESRNFHWPANAPLDQTVQSYGDAQTITPSNTLGIDEVGIENFTTTGKVLFAAGDRATPTRFATAGSGNLASGKTKDIAASSVTLADEMNAASIEDVNETIEAVYGSTNPLDGTEKVLRVPTDLGDDSLTNWFAFKPSADVPSYEILVALFNPANDTDLTSPGYRSNEAGGKGAVVWRWSSDGAVFNPFNATAYELLDSSSLYTLATGWKWLGARGSPLPQVIGGVANAAIIMREFAGDLDDDGPKPRGSRMAAAVYVGSTGTVTVDTIEGRKVTFKAVQKGTTLPIYCTKVYKTGTSATDLVALYPPPGA